jgi:hypothetical protein
MGAEARPWHRLARRRVGRVCVRRARFGLDLAALLFHFEVASNLSVDATAAELQAQVVAFEREHAMGVIEVDLLRGDMLREAPAFEAEVVEAAALQRDPARSGQVDHNATAAHQPQGPDAA